MKLTIQNLIDDESCYKEFRQLRWPNGVCCPGCQSTDIINRGKHNKLSYRQRYQCKGCQKRFDDLTDTVFEGHHQPLKVWIIFLYFMGLNLSNSQIAKELGLNKDDAHRIARILRSKVVEKKPEVQLSGEVELDELYVVAGHKGNHEAVKKKAENREEDD